MKKSILWLVLIQFVLALEWLVAGWEKLSKPGFMKGISGTLSAFEHKTTFSTYAKVMHAQITPHATLVGNVVRLSELLIAGSLIGVGILALKKSRLRQSWRVLVSLTLLWAAFLNLNFFLATSWTGPSSEGVNFVMGATEVILALYYLIGYQPALKSK